MSFCVANHEHHRHHCHSMRHIPGVELVMGVGLSGLLLSVLLSLVQLRWLSSIGKNQTAGRKRV